MSLCTVNGGFILGYSVHAKGNVLKRKFSMS
jgi:hypothetical protein